MDPRYSEHRTLQELADIKAQIRAKDERIRALKTFLVAEMTEVNHAMNVRNDTMRLKRRDFHIVSLPIQYPGIVLTKI